MQLTKNARQRKGFSLTELAIVVAVVGVLIGGIWTYAGSAIDNSNRQQLAGEIISVVKNARAAFQSQSSVCGTADQLTARLVNLNAIPSTMVRTTGCTNVGMPANSAPAGICVDTPWNPAANKTNGSFAVSSGFPSPPGPAATAPSPLSVPCAAADARQQFTVELRNVSYANCVFVVPQNSGSTGPPGIVDVIINGTDILTDASTTHALPVKVQDAQALCTATSTIDFVYKVQQAAF